MYGGVGDATPLTPRLPPKVWLPPAQA